MYDHRPKTANNGVNVHCVGKSKVFEYFIFHAVCFESIILESKSIVRNIRKKSGDGGGGDGGVV